MNVAMVIITIILIAVVLIVLMRKNSQAQAFILQLKDRIFGTQRADTGHEVENVDPPTIYYKPYGQNHYISAPVMRFEEYWIGRSQNSDLILNDPTVEYKHAVILRKIGPDGQSIYTLKSLAKQNPIRVIKKGYDTYYLKKGKQIELEEKHCVFILGRTHVVIFLNEEKDDIMEDFVNSVDEEGVMYTMDSDAGDEGEQTRKINRDADDEEEQTRKINRGSEDIF